MATRASSSSSFDSKSSTPTNSPSPRASTSKMSLFEHISTAFTSLPSYSFDFNYPMYPHSDDALPRLHMRNSSSSSDSESDGVRTPPQSPHLLPAPTDKSAPTDLSKSSRQPAEWDSPELGVIALPHRHQQLFALTPLTPTPSKPKPKSTTLPLQPTVPKPPTKRSSAAQRSSVPSREDEERGRGRSRWPRLLWTSTVDEESLEVLRSYHERAVGGPLPVLERGRGERGVREWSGKLEKAGL